MKNVFRTNAAVLLALLPAAAAGQQAGIPEQAAENMTRQVNAYPQEKIYVQTDRGRYISGEQVWFRAHLVNARTHVPDTASRYVYTELVDPTGEVVLRVKIRNQQGVYAGYFPLPAKLPQGEYMLRAYTHYMINLDESYFFRRRITVLEPGLADTEVEIEEKGKEYALSFENSYTGEAETPSSVRVLDKTRKPVEPFRQNDEGGFTFPARDLEGERYVLVEADGWRSYRELPAEGGFDVSFHPEGGYLLEGTAAAVGFKAVGADGFGREIEGKLFDHDNTLVTIFRSVHQGMGVFSFVPEAGKRYYAECDGGDGNPVWFDLPETRSEGFGLQVARANGNYRVGIQRTPSTPERPLYLLVHCRGSVIYAEAWDFRARAISFEEGALPTGVIHFVLLDDRLHTLSERLAFAQADDQASVAFRTGKVSYGRREKADAYLTVTGPDGEGRRASLSVSVTDLNDRATDTAMNIYTSLLLTSDLRGYVEDPGFYFSGAHPKMREAALDALMLTQGWRRYDLPAVVKGEIGVPKEPLEIGQEISGTVLNYMGRKPVERARVTIISPQTSYFDIATSDSKGRFFFHNMDHPDSTSYIAQANAQRGHNRVTLEIDAPSFPAAFYTLPPLRSEREAAAPYVAKAQQRHLSVHGMRLVEMEAIAVHGSRYPAKSRLRSRADQIYDTEALERSNAPTLEQFFRHSGIQIHNNKAYLRTPQSFNPAIVVVDGIQYQNLWEYGQIPLDQIEMIEFSRTSPAMAGDFMGSASDEESVEESSRRTAYGGIIYVETKTGAYTAADGDHIKKFTVLGYQKPAEFYAPKYLSASEKNNPRPDLRTTIDWLPGLATDAEGKARFDFHTADSDSDYLVTIEGVTEEGETVFAREIVRRK